MFFILLNDQYVDNFSWVYFWLFAHWLIFSILLSPIPPQLIRNKQYDHIKKIRSEMIFRNMFYIYNYLFLSVCRTSCPRGYYMVKPCTTKKDVVCKGKLFNCSEHTVLLDFYYFINKINRSNDIAINHSSLESLGK